MSNSLADLRIKLAAAHRMAVLDQLNEGTWNHFTAVVPGRPDLMLTTPVDRHWRQVTAESLVLVDAQGRALDGNQIFDASAYHIHYPIHTARADAVCVLHAHPPYTTALSMLKGGRLQFAEQNAATFYGRVAYFEEYDGFIGDLEGGRRLAAALGDKRVLFLQNHGVVVVGPTIADAYTDLYSLERACMFQCHAQAMGGAMRVIPPAVGEATASGADGYKQMHFAAMQRLLDAEQPDYRN